MSTFLGRSAMLICFTVGLAPSIPAQDSSDLSNLKTRAERTNFRETSRYDDVIDFMEAVDEVSPLIHLTTFGYTFEGRALPLAVVGHLDGADPQSVISSGKTRVYLQGNIHAGEVEGKEVLQVLLRELAQGQHAEWLDPLVLLIAPIYNADGNERVTLTNRTNRRGISQHGPVGGMGQRPNAQGYDLNRDHMKLDTPEARSFVRLMSDYAPHVAVDLHTTDGTRHAYHLTYAPPLHPNTYQGIVDLLRNDWLSILTKNIKKKYGWDFYYYGNLPFREGQERGWYTFDHRPRFGNNYAGLRNRFGILSEAYSYATFEERFDATRRFVEEILDYAQEHAAKLRQIVAAADAAPLVGKTLAVRAEPERSEKPVEILLGDVREERHPHTGAIMPRRLDVRKPEMMPEFGTFAPSESERVPAAYLIPARLGGVIDRLEAHGVKMSKMERSATLEVEEFAIASTETAERAFEQHNERTVTGSYRTVTKEIPAGTMVVPMEQPLARLAFYLLEPRSDDGFLDWNVLDDALKDADTYPILRKLTP